MWTIVNKMYVKKDYEYKNTQACHFCFWKESPQYCDQLSTKKDIVELNNLVNIVI